MLSSLPVTLYLVSFHFPEAGLGHLSDASSAIRRFLDRMVSSSQEGLVKSSLFSNRTLCSWSSSRLLAQGSLDARIPAHLGEAVRPSPVPAARCRHPGPRGHAGPSPPGDRYPGGRKNPTGSHSPRGRASHRGPHQFGFLGAWPCQSWNFLVMLIQ